MAQKDARPAMCDPTPPAGSRRHALTTAEVDAMGQPGACTHFTLNSGAPFARPGGRKPAGKPVGSEGVGAALRGDGPEPSHCRPRLVPSKSAGARDLIAPTASGSVSDEPIVHFTLVDGVPMEKTKGGRSISNRPAGCGDPIVGGNSHAEHKSGRRHFHGAVSSSILLADDPAASMEPCRKSSSGFNMSTVVGSLLRDCEAVDGLRLGEVRKHDYRIGMGRPNLRPAAS